METEEFQLLLSRLLAPSPATTDQDRVDRLRAMEQLRNALAAAQAKEAVAFADSQREQQRAMGFGEHRVGRGIADQVALARMESPNKGSRLLGLAHALVHEMPECLAALERGEVSEWRVTGVVRETAVLEPEDRRAVDANLGPRLKDLGDRVAAGEARAMADRLDPVAAATRHARAVTERRVGIRPAPDAMTYVTASLPMHEGVAVYAALHRLAAEALAAGDERKRAQHMADTLVERVTGRQVGTVPFRLCLVMTDAALVGADDTPASMPGFGTVSRRIAQDWLRRLVRPRPQRDQAPGGRALDDEGWTAQVVSFADLVLLNRLFTSPDGRDLVAMESTHRGYTGLLRTMLEIRDQVCRTPWCEAPVTQIDHVQRVEHGGLTTFGNGRGLCTRCNLAREAPAWGAAVTSGPQESHEVTTTTPTGHTYPSSTRTSSRDRTHRARAVP